MAAAGGQWALACRNSEVIRLNIFNAYNTRAANNAAPFQGPGVRGRSTGTYHCRPGSRRRIIQSLTFHSPQCGPGAPPSVLQRWATMAFVVTLRIPDEIKCNPCHGGCFEGLVRTVVEREPPGSRYPSPPDPRQPGGARRRGDLPSHSVAPRPSAS